ncbi:MAG: UbiA prenyltransferase family protein [Thermoproteota archaeon]
MFNIVIVIGSARSRFSTPLENRELEMANVKDYLFELRIQDAYKNLLILLPSFFGGKLFITNYYPNLALGFLAFSLTSSACYIINDIKDAPLDAYHPKKKLRPIASGKMSKPSTILFFTRLASRVTNCIVFDRNQLFNPLFTAISELASIHFLLREIVWADVASVSLNYVIRTLAGCEIVHVTISPWLLIGVFYVSMTLVLAKRREELATLAKPELHRKTLKNYNIRLIDKTILALSILTLVSYSFYTFCSPYSHGLLPFTIPLMTLIILRFIIVSKNTSETRIIRKIITDKVMVVSLLVWFIIMFY